MGRHRRYQIKKRKKIQPTDPLERIRPDPKKNLFNRAPTLDELDVQPVPRRLEELKQNIADAKAPKKRIRKKMPENKLYALTAQMGLQKRPWESDAAFTRRAIYAKNVKLDEEFVKVQAGLGGRAKKELDADMKELDEKERQKKLLKVALREKRLKLREKEQKFREVQKRKGIETGEFDDLMEQLNENLAEDGDEDEGSIEESADEMEDDAKVADSKVGMSMAIRADVEDEDAEEMKPPKKRRGRNVKNVRDPSEPKPKRLSAKQKARLKREAAKEEEEKYMLLNAREIIPFGERVDAPPKFTTNFRKTIDPLNAQAGKKNLLLKAMLSKAPSASNSSLNADNFGGSRIEPTKKAKVSEEDRRQIIESYREIKRIRHHF